MAGNLQKSDAERAAMRCDFVKSLSVLALLVAFALSGLAWDENWRKLLRVLIGFSVYVLILLPAFSLYSSFKKRAAHLPFWPFALAGAAAELSSGWLRPTARAPFDLLTAIAAAILIGGVHWLALRFWRSLYERIVRPKQRSTA